MPTLNWISKEAVVKHFSFWAALPSGLCQSVMVKDKRWDWIEEQLRQPVVASD